MWLYFYCDFDYLESEIQIILINFVPHREGNQIFQGENQLFYRESHKTHKCIF
jgi:hypothetical protein